MINDVHITISQVKRAYLFHFFALKIVEVSLLKKKTISDTLYDHRSNDFYPKLGPVFFQNFVQIGILVV